MDHIRPHAGDQPALATPIDALDHVRGPATALITLVEYGDYQCPVSLNAHRVLPMVERLLGTNLRYVYRHFPLSQLHPHAQMAAEAAEAAHEQGAFWEMHDQLFEHQTALNPEDLVVYAQQLGLDARRFIEEVSAHEHAARVRRDFLSGVQSGVRGTPTFYFNGARYDGPWHDPVRLAEDLFHQARAAVPFAPG